MGPSGMPAAWLVRLGSGLRCLSGHGGPTIAADMTAAARYADVSSPRCQTQTSKQRSRKGWLVGGLGAHLRAVVCHRRRVRRLR